MRQGRESDRLKSQIHGWQYMTTELRDRVPGQAREPVCEGMHLLVGSNTFNLANSGPGRLYRKSQASDAYQPSYYTRPIEARKLPPFVGPL